MMSANSRLLATAIRNQRILHGFMQTELSRVSGIPAAEISRVERGRLFPSAEFLMKISAILGIDRSRLLMCAAFVALGEPRIRPGSLYDILDAFRYVSGLTE